MRHLAQQDKTTFSHRGAYSARERLVLLLGAAAAISLAFAILWAVGLPDPLALLTASELPPGNLPTAPLVGAAAPSFVAVDSNEQIVSLEALRGSPVILNFWATWCVPCALELPELQALYEARQAEGLRILAVNVDEPPAVFVPWAAARGLTFDLLPDPGREIQARYHLRGTPQTVLVDREGIIRDIFYGAVNLARLESALDALQ